MNNSSSKRRSGFGRRIVLSLLTFLAGRRRRDRLAPGGLQRILLIRYDRLGDAVITAPLIDALAVVAPHAEIDVLASPANADIFRADSRITYVHVWQRSVRARLQTIRSCRARHYDAVFQLILNRTTLPALLAAAIAGQGRTIGKHVIDHERLFDHPIETGFGHYVDMTFALIDGLALDAPIAPPPGRLIINDTARAEATGLLAAAGLADARFVVLNVSAGVRTRELNREQNTALVRALGAMGVRVVVIGAPTAVTEMKTIAEASGAVNMATSSIQAAAAVIAAARMVVTPDTAIVHIASAVGTPTVALFAAHGDPMGWGPRGVRHAIVHARTDTLDSIDVGEIVAAAAKLLGSLNDEGRH